MVQSQSLVVKFHRLIVRFPFPYKNEVNESDNQHYFNRKIFERFKQNVNHECDFDHQIKNKIKQNVSRFVIGPVRVVFIMLQFLNHGCRSPGLLFFGQSGMLELIVRGEHFLRKHEECQKDKEDILYKIGFVNQIKKLCIFFTGLRCGWDDVKL